MGRVAVAQALLGSLCPVSVQRCAILRLKEGWRCCLHHELEVVAFWNGGLPQLTFRLRVQVAREDRGAEALRCPKAVGGSLPGRG